MQIIAICIVFIFLVFFKAIAVKLFLCNNADVFVKGAQRGLVLNFLAEFYNSFFVWTYRLALHSCSEPCFFSLSADKRIIAAVCWVPIYIIKCYH